MTSQVRAPSRFGVSRGERLRIVLLLAAIAAATGLGAFASYLIGQASVALAGLSIAAYVLGLRHGVDADHIVAIDNTTRKLMQEDQRPLTVGTWFSLGHSTVVLGLTVGFVLAARAIAGQIPALQNAGTVIGFAVSGVFLVLIGVINLVIVLGVYRAFVELRSGRGAPTASEVDAMLGQRGFLSRFFGSLFRLIRRPWQIYPVGLLFGLGFDTATEVLLFGIAMGVGMSSAIPVWMILVLPYMFACGMVLVDTVDGVAMRVAYGWAFLHPMRKVYYNLTVTLLSVLAAFGIGGIEILQLFAVQLNLSGAFWDSLRSLGFEGLGFGIIAMFLVAWAVSIAYWKYKGYDEWVTPA